jgi:hypothetical protein
LTAYTRMFTSCCCQLVWPQHSWQCIPTKAAQTLLTQRIALVLKISTTHHKNSSQLAQRMTKVYIVLGTRLTSPASPDRRADVAAVQELVHQAARTSRELAIRTELIEHRLHIACVSLQKLCSLVQLWAVEDPVIKCSMGLVGRLLCSSQFCGWGKGQHVKNLRQSFSVPWQGYLPIQ